MDEIKTEDGKPYAKYLYLKDGRYRRCGNCLRYEECRKKHDKRFVYSERGACIHHVGE